MESITETAERCLKVWSNRSDEIYFQEQIMVEDYIKQQCEEGEPLEDVEAGIVGYLESQKGNGYELIKVLENIINK